MDLIPRSFFLDDMFDNFLTSKDTNSFKCDIYEKDGNYCIEMDAPGYTKDNIKIDCDNGYLTIKVSKSDESTDDGKNYIRKERSTREYQRTFYVGDVDTNDIKATFKDGILKIDLPKPEVVETKKTIEIE